MFQGVHKVLNSHKIILVATVVYVIALAGTTCSVAANDAGFRAVLDESGAYSCLSSKEAELLQLVNDYREKNGLPAVANSRSLNKVARSHVLDLYVNRPIAEKNIHGENCNLHSWSYNGFWTPVCYTKVSNTPELMWFKAKEITSYLYSSPVYENAYYSSDENAIPYRTFLAWKKSPTHNALILETGIWKGLNIKAIGVGIHKGFAVIWVGETVDSLGPMNACST